MRLMLFLLLVSSCDDAEYKKQSCRNINSYCKYECYKIVFPRQPERRECVDACVSYYGRCKGEGSVTR